MPLIITEDFNKEKIITDLLIKPYSDKAGVVCGICLRREGLILGTDVDIVIVDLNMR